MRGSAPAKVGAGSAAVAAVVRAAMGRAASEVGAARAVLPTVRLLARLAVESLAREVGVAKALGTQAAVASEAAVMAPAAVAREVGAAMGRSAAAAAARGIRQFVLPCRQIGSCGPCPCSKLR